MHINLLDYGTLTSQTGLRWWLMLLASSNMVSFEILWLMHGTLSPLLSRAGAKAQDVVVVVTSWASALAWRSLDV